MDWDQLFYLPEWDESAKRFGEEGEEWKTRPAYEAAKKMYLQWQEVFYLVVAFTETLKEEEGNENITRHLIYENAMIVAPKIMGAVAGTLYIIQMENAAIIRQNCKQLMEQVNFAAMMGAADERHQEVIKEAMHRFRACFIQWVATFRKDEYEDEWGLFV